MPPRYGSQKRVYHAVQSKCGPPLRRTRLALALACLAALSLILASVREITPGSPPHEDALPSVVAPGEVVVRWKDAPSASAISAVGGTGSSPLTGDRLSLLQVPVGSEISAAHVLSARQDVEWAQPNYIRQAQFLPNDPLFDQQWALARIQAPEAWEMSLGSPSITVAVVDTGVDLGHPDLQGRLIEGWNVLDPSSPPSDDGGHGTHVAGTIGAIVNNNIGVAGIASGVSIMPVKVLTGKGSGKDSDVATGMQWAVDRGARVINLSFNGYQRSRLLQEAVTYASSRDVIVVAAAGNDARSNRSYPAAIQPAIAVAATNDQDQRADYSNFGDWIDIAAPGDRILSTSWDGQSTYRSDSGTSMSASQVSGVVGLLLSVRPALTTGDVRTILKSVADPVPGGGLGAGRLNAARAVRAAVEGLPAPSPVPTARPAAAPAARTLTATPTTMPSPTAPTATPQPGVRSVALTYNAPTAGRTVYLPAVLRGRDGWTTQISVQNATSTVASVAIELVDQAGSIAGTVGFRLRPNGSGVLRSEEMTFLTPPWAGSGVVRSDVPVAVVVQMDREGFNSMAYEGQVQTDTRLVAPLVSKGQDDWISAVFVQNAAAEPATTELQFRSSDGALAWVETASIPPNAHWALDLATTSSLPDGFVGSVTALSRDDRPLAMVVASIGPSATAISFAGASAGGGQLIGPNITKNRVTVGTWNTTIVLQNPGEEPAAVRLTYTSANAPRVMRTEEALIAPGATGVFRQAANPSLPDGFVGNVEVVVAGGQTVVGLVVGVNLDRGVSFAYRLATGAAEVHAPVVRRSQGTMEATVDVANLGQAQTTVVVTYRTPSGQSGVAQIARLSPGAVLNSIPSAPGLTEGFTGSATVVSREGQPLAVTVSHVRY